MQQDVHRPSRPLPPRRHGTFVILTAVGLITFLGMAALVTDVGFSYSRRQRTQEVIDMAGLATLASLNPQTALATNQTIVNARVQAILAANSVPASAIVTVAFSSSGTGGNILITTRKDESAVFGSLYGWNNFSVANTTLVTGIFIPAVSGLDGAGIFGCASMKITQGAYIDAFDSRNGPYSGHPNHYAATGTATSPNQWWEYGTGTNPASIPNPYSNAADPSLPTGSRWSDGNGRGTTSPKCYTNVAVGHNGGDNCSSRVLIGSFGSAAIASGTEPAVLYGTIWSDTQVTLSMACYIDRSIYCAGCAINDGGSYFGGVSDTNAPPLNLGTCDLASLMPCDLFTDDTSAAPIQARVTDGGARAGTFTCGAETYNEVLTPTVGMTANNIDLDNMNTSYTFTTGKIYDIVKFTTSSFGCTVTLAGDYTSQPPPVLVLGATTGSDKCMDLAKETIFNMTAKCDAAASCPQSKWSDQVGMRIYGEATCSLVNFKKANDSKLIVVDIVAPTALCDIDKDYQTGGRLICGTVDIKKDAEFHYDEALGGKLELPPSSNFTDIRIHQ